ncbi:MAG: hypothetical protein ACKVS8_07875 [Phycisphaerales bacterium]
MTAAGQTEQGGDVAAPLPTIATALTPEQVVATLDGVARRGKLPGFVAGGGRASDGVLFVVDAFSTPFDGRVRARALAGESGGRDVRPTEPGSTTLAFEVRLKPLWPTVFVVAMVLAIWPGVILTESLLASIFPHTPWTWEYTWWWYMPLSILGCPWAIWDAFGKSRRGARVSAREAIAGIGAALDAGPA